MDKIDQNNIKALRQFFNTSIAIFEMKHTISKSLGRPSPKSDMHKLHVIKKYQVLKRCISFCMKWKSYLITIVSEINGLVRS